VNPVRVTALTVIFAAAAASVAGATATWANTGPSWTLRQARTALLTTPRIWGADYRKCQLGVPPPGCYREWLLQPTQMFTLKPDGPAVMKAGARTWRRFSVAVYGQNLVDFGSMQATFCLHVAGPVRTSYPYFAYTLSGFLAPTTYNPIGCKDSPTARTYKGGIDR